MISRNLLLSFFLGILLFIGCSKKEVDSQKVTIATAANMQYAMQSLSETFIQKTGIPCEIILASSGKLTAQIKAGAPYDIFISADIKYPQSLFQAGLSNEPKVYAYGKLVLWTMDKNLELSIKSLQSENIEHIAIANPKIAPYGSATIEVLDHYKLTKSIADKFVFGESISQTNQFINSQVAEIGFTAMSVVKAPKNQNKGKWISIDDNLHKPIEQGVVIINRKEVSLNAKQFYDFMFSNEAKEILVNFGYIVE